MEWLWFAAGAALFRTLKDVGFKEAIGPVTLASTLAFWLIILVCLSPFAVWSAYRTRLHRGAIVRNYHDALWGVCGSAVLDAIAYWMFLESLRVGSFAASTPLRNTVPLFAFVIGVFLMGERATVARMGAAFSVVAGVFVIEGGDFKFEYASLLALGSAALFAVSTMFNRFAVAENRAAMPAIVYSFLLMTASGALYGTVVLALNLGHDALTEFVALVTNVKMLILIGMCGALGTVCTAQAFVKGEITQVVPALRIQAVLGVLAGYFFFGENISAALPGSLLILVGVILVRR